MCSRRGRVNWSIPRSCRPTVVSINDTCIVSINCHVGNYRCGRVLEMANVLKYFTTRGLPCTGFGANSHMSDVFCQTLIVSMYNYTFA